MVVEDDADSRLMLAAALELAGCAVVTAANGREAYDLAQEHRPAVILLDLMMPMMAGEEFREAQLANVDIRNIPVIVISAHHEAPRIALRMQASGCVTKPVDFERLEMLVREHCA